MSLFTRLLMSLYPEQLLSQPGSPAGMFLGMISPQSFFNIVTKKMAENYKINHFDVALDPFEVKIGFGEQSMIKPKAMQSYYSYCAAANLNGYQNYTVGMLATTIVMVASHYLRPLVNYPSQHRYLTHLLFSLYVVVHVFATRIKEFPTQDINQSYQWLMDIWFNYYQLILQYNHKTQPFDQAIVDQIKTRVLGQIELGFGIYRMMRQVNHLLTDQLDRTYLKWLCDQEVTKNIDMSQTDLIDHIVSRCHDAELNQTDYDVMQVILPHDFAIKYFFGQQDVYHTIDYIVSDLYDWQEVDRLLLQCIDGEHAATDLIKYICNHNHMKQHFFAGVREMVVSEIRGDDVDPEDIEEFVSMIGSGVINQIPESLRRESMVTERLMNFYLNYMGSLWGARGDSFELMLDHRIAQMIHTIKHDTQPNAHEIDLYRHYLKQYSTNASYYHYVYEGVRSGKASFTLPYIIESNDVYAHMSMIDLLIQSSMVSTMQDILHKEVKLYPQAPSMIRQFKTLYGDRVSDYLKSDIDQLIKYVQPLLTVDQYELVRQDHFVAAMRDSLYTIDIHCYHDVLTQLMSHPTYQSKYGVHASILIAGTLRETLYGLLCMMAMLDQQTKYSQNKSQELSQFLLTSYVIHVLGLQDTATMIVCFDMIYGVYGQVADLLGDSVKLDDNEEFLMMGAEFMHRFLKDKEDPVKAHLALLNEDVVRLRGYLKHINYYNKRYFIPQN